MGSRLKTFLIDENKEYPVKWADDPYSDDGDLFLEGEILLDEGEITVTMGITGCIYEPALKQESFVKFKTFTEESSPDLLIGYYPIEWGSEPTGDWLFTTVEKMDKENIYKVTFDDGEENDN